MSSLATKIFTCRRVSPDSVRTRSRTPGYAANSTCKAARKSAPSFTSTCTLLRFSVNSRSGPGMLNTTCITAVPALDAFRARSFPFCRGFRLEARPRCRYAIHQDDRSLDAHDLRQSFQDFLPALSFVFRGVQLSATGSKINSCWIQRIRREGIPQNGFVRPLLRQPAFQRLPRTTGIPRAINTQTPFRRAAKLVRFHRHDVHAVRVVGMHQHCETEVRRHSARDVLP